MLVGPLVRMHPLNSALLASNPGQEVIQLGKKFGPLQNDSLCGHSGGQHGAFNIPLLGIEFLISQHLGNFAGDIRARDRVLIALVYLTAEEGG
jgi:hypothetical protein